ncbi:MAG TPA: KUP/HAK/KT family potassium transporter, partial [Novosphingobium sp.]
EGTAVFLTQDLAIAPAALLHNLKHNKALHRTSILLKVETLTTPWVEPAERLVLEPLDNCFSRARLRYGYMDKIDVPTDLASSGLLTAPGGTSFFVGRSAIRFATRPLLPRWMTAIYMVLHRNAADPTAYFAIPANRVVELGGQIEL